MTLFLTEQYVHLFGFFFWMFGSFLIGYIFAWLYYKRDKENKTEDTIYNTIHTVSETETPTIIRAKKTVERGGIEVKYPKELKFDLIGKGNEKEKDDLTKINGIGDFIEKKLNSIGVYNYEQLSKISKDEIEAITELIEFFPGRILRDKWKDQAKELLKEIEQ